MTARVLPWKPLGAAALLGLVLGGCGETAARRGQAERAGVAADPVPLPAPAAAPAADEAIAAKLRNPLTQRGQPGSLVAAAASPAPPGQPSPAAPESEVRPRPTDEKYAQIQENPFRRVAEQPLSTFGIDVDTASYSNVRRFLTQNTLPPRDAVRVEELINYFPFDDPSPLGDVPFAISVEVGRCQWAQGHRLARIGIKGRTVAADQRPASNLVFLIDVSGSMADANKLPLVRSALRLLVQQLGENDRVAIVVYAGASGLALPSTPCHRKAEILAALDRLQAGGSTNGSAGLTLAYEVAVSHFITGGTNRVILCTDGDFNVGITGEGELTRLIETRARSGVFLSAMGFGMGNYKDSTMERLADRGNGVAAYIDSIQEAAKVFVEQMSGTLVTIAKDVKIQVEFNPHRVQAYRLIGYEDRLLKAQDFNDDRKDAGEIGAGHSVTALYEIVEVDAAGGGPGVDPLRYQAPAPTPAPAPGAGADTTHLRELFAVKVRSKAPASDKSELIEFAVEDNGVDDRPTDNFRFASAVAAFGLLLRDSPARGTANWDDVITLAESSQGPDRSGYRREFLELARKARSLAER